jgi:hypothetical protein
VTPAANELQSVILCHCTEGNPTDTDNNAVDFIFVDPFATSAGAGQRLGAPGPENLSSPISGPPSISNTLLDICVGGGAPPNMVRDFTSDPGNNSTFGTIEIRRTFTNNTGGNITRLRFRIVDLDTFPAPSGFADLRPRTSSTIVVTVDRPPCGSGTSNITVEGTTLEQPPTQPNGGGFNSSMGAGTVTLATPLANGATIDLRFLFGVQQNGDFQIGLVIEALPMGGEDADFLFLQCNTQTLDCVAPGVLSSVRADPNPTTAASVNFTVTFSEPVTGVDVTDFALTTTGTIAGASVTNVSGSGASYTVTVDTGSGFGTIRLDVADDDTIVNGIFLPLGDTGPGNGDFTTGEAYTLNSPTCGDGVTDLGEECDDGAANSDTTPDACRTDCLNPSCGDGVTDMGEECDDGTANSDTIGDACRTDCTNPSCGDGVTDLGEECDDGAANSDTIADACRTDCTNPTSAGQFTLGGGGCSFSLDPTTASRPSAIIWALFVLAGLGWKLKRISM